MSWRKGSRNDKSELEKWRSDASELEKRRNDKRALEKGKNGRNELENETTFKTTGNKSKVKIEDNWKMLQTSLFVSSPGVVSSQRKDE